MFIETGYAATVTVDKIRLLFGLFNHIEGEWRLEIVDRN